MNKEQRKQLSEYESTLCDIKDAIEEMRDDEQSKYDNLPESLQYSEKGEAFENIIETLDSAIESLESSIDYISDAQE